MQSVEMPVSATTGLPVRCGGVFAPSSSQQSRWRCYLVAPGPEGKPVLLANVRMEQN